MEKAQIQSLITNQVKIIYSLLSAFGLFIIAVLDLYEEKYHFAIIAAAFAFLLVVYATYLLVFKPEKESSYPEWGLVSLLLAFTLFGMQESEQVVHWVYFVPIYTFFLIPFRIACGALLVYSAIMGVMVLNQFPLEARWQILFTYGTCLAFSFMYALLNERNNAYLKKIINTDPNTQVYNEYQLNTDLNKELVRANRQGSQLFLMSIAIPEQWNSLKVEELEKKLSMVSRGMRRVLREYDCCYRLDNNNFVILFPQVNKEAIDEQEKTLRNALKGNAKADQILTVNVVQALPEDDVNSLLRKVKGDKNAS